MRLASKPLLLGLVAAIAAVAVVGTALAQTPTPTPKQSGTNYGNFFIDRLASALGVTTDKLKSAATQARNETADQAVKDGKLTQQQADNLKANQGNAPFGFGFHGFGPGAKPGMNGQLPGVRFMGGGQVWDAVAKVLGMASGQELQTQLRSGKTLADLSTGKEQAVKDAMAGVVKPQLDQAVANSRMTQDQENKALARIQSLDLSKIGGKQGMKGRDGNRGNPQTPAPNRPSRGTTPSFSGAL